MTEPEIRTAWAVYALWITGIFGFIGAGNYLAAISAVCGLMTAVAFWQERISANRWKTAAWRAVNRHD